MKNFLIIVGIVALFGAGILLYFPQNYILGHAVKYPSVGYSTDIITAANNKDISICDKISNTNERYNCYSFFADITNDASVCKRIINSDKENICIAISEDEPSLCEKILSQKKKDECYYELVARPKDISMLSPDLCEKIKNNEMRDKCYIIVATGIEAEPICEKITDMRLQDNCYLYVDKLKA